MQGVLLAIMNVLVFVLPLYQLWRDFRDPFHAVRAKAAQSFRNVSQRLRSRFSTRLGAPDLEIAQEPAEVDYYEQASSYGQLCAAGVPLPGSIVCTFKSFPRPRGAARFIAMALVFTDRKAHV